MIIDGQKVTRVADLLGHSDPGVTLKVYAHWFKDVKTDAMATLARVVCNGSSDKAKKTTR